LKDDVRIVRDIPDWFTEKEELFTSIKLVASVSAIPCIGDITFCHLNISITIVTEDYYTLIT
jgi:hypothetical protein